MAIKTPYLARQYDELTADSPQQFRMAFFSPMLSTNFVHDNDVDKIHQSPSCSTYQYISSVQPVRDFEGSQRSVNQPVVQLVDLAGGDNHLSMSDHDFEQSKVDFDPCPAKFPTPLLVSSGEISYHVMSVATKNRPSPVVPFMSLQPNDHARSFIQQARIRSWSTLLPAIDEMVELSDERLLHHDLQALSQRQCLVTCAQSQTGGSWLWQPWARTERWINPERWKNPPCPGEVLEV
jgi:hypothetical protein